MKREEKNPFDQVDDQNPFDDVPEDYDPMVSGNVGYGETRFGTIDRPKDETVDFKRSAFRQDDLVDRRQDTLLDELHRSGDFERAVDRISDPGITQDDADEPTDPTTAFINTGINYSQKDPVPREKDKYGGELMREVGRSMIHGAGLVGSTVKQIGESTGLEGVAEAGQGFKELTDDLVKQIPARRVADHTAIRTDTVDNFATDLSDWLTVSAGQAIGTGAPMIASGIVGGFAGLATVSLGYGIGEMRQALEEAGVDDPKTLERYSYGVGAVIAGLDAIVPWDVMNSMSPGTKKALGKYIVTRFAAEVGKTAAKEGITELLQESAQIAGVAHAKGDSIAMRLIEERTRLIEAGLSGMVGGGTLGAPGAVAAAARGGGVKEEDERPAIAGPAAETATDGTTEQAPSPPAEPTPEPTAQAATEPEFKPMASPRGDRATGEHAATKPQPTPTFSDLLQALPLDEAGDPDVLQLSSKLDEMGVQRWNDLSDSQKLSVYQELGNTDRGEANLPPSPAPQEQQPPRSGLSTSSGSGPSSVDVTAAAVPPSPTDDKADRARLVRDMGNQRTKKALFETARAAGVKIPESVVKSAKRRRMADLRQDIGRLFDEQRPSRGSPPRGEAPLSPPQVSEQSDRRESLEANLRRARSKKKMVEAAVDAGVYVPAAVQARIKTWTMARLEKLILDTYDQANPNEDGNADGPDVRRAETPVSGQELPRVPPTSREDRTTESAPAGDRAERAGPVRERGGPVDEPDATSRRDAQSENEADGPGAARGRPGRDARVDLNTTVDRAVVQERQQVAKELAERRATNYRITEDDQIGKGGPKEKVRRNIAAIKVLKALEDEGRPPTAEEKAVLVRYVGWGAFAQDVFNQYSRNQSFASERAQILALLTPEEIAAARASTLNAHFTSEEVIRGIWSAVEYIGYTGGRALEPSAGVGHFMGLTPENVVGQTQWSAVELDSITGRILEQLYPGANVSVAGFETVSYPDGFFDLAISNVPFGDYKIGGSKHNIHDYFFLRSLDKVRPGGVVAFVTSTGTLDKQSEAVRREMARGATFLGAVRLPGGKRGAFAGNAGTDVTTDIIFLRKRQEGEPQGDMSWIETVEHKTPDGKTRINRYFAENPNMMLGKMRLQGSMYRADTPVLVGSNKDLDVQIMDAVRSGMEAGTMPERGRQTVQEEARQQIDEETDGGIKEGAFYVKAGKVYRKVLGIGRTEKMSKPDARRVRAFIPLRDTFNEMLARQARGETQGMDELRAQLTKHYEAFVEEFGPINRTIVSTSSRTDRNGNPIVTRRMPNFAALRNDPDAYKVAALENYDLETDTATKSAAFTEDIVTSYNPPDIVGPADALAVSLNETGGVNIPLIAERMQLTEDEAISALGSEIYQNPNGGAWELSALYLSGDVVTKLEEARAAVEQDKSYKRNVEALEAVQPVPLTRVDIFAPMGAPWISGKVYSDFFATVLGGRDMSASAAPQIRLNPATKRWTWVGKPYFAGSAQSEFGTERVGVSAIILSAMNGEPITVRDKIDAETYVVNDAATREARAKVELARERFAGDRQTGAEGWLWEDETRAQETEARYNAQFNRLVPTVYNGDHLQLPGLASTLALSDGRVVPFSLRPHQKNAVWRTIVSGNTLLDHTVGAGKTFTMIASAMEQRRLGLINRPMVVVPNHMLEQFSREWLQAYPNAKLLIADKESMSKAKRKEFAARVAAERWDAVIITHDAFGRIRMSNEAYERFYADRITELEDMKADEDQATVKEIEKAKKKLENRLDKLTAKERKDDGITFEELGIDFLYVDEAHLFKNLEFMTRHTRVKGIGGTASQRATDLFVKIQELERRRPNRSTVFATGTPVSNTMAEMYTMQRYLQMQTLREYGIEEFDAWAGTFGEVTSQIELAPNGRSMRETTSFSRFVNIPELVAIYSRVADTQTADMLNLPRPEVDGGVRIVEAQPNDVEEDYIQSLVRRAEAIKGKRPEKGEDNMLKILGEGLKVATDMRLIDPSAEFNPNGKIAQAVDRIFGIWERGQYPAMAQIVFLDMGVPGSKSRAAPSEDSETGGGQEEFLSGNFNLYEDIRRRLVERGIPRDQIVFIHEANSDEKKAKLFGDVRSGKVRVLIGSTGKMGVGTNVQRLLKAMHHIDAPWKPAEVEQRDGRIERQGNENDLIEIYRYITVRSLDAYRWQTLDRKARFIAQLRAGARGVRSAEDIDSPLPEAAEMKAAATGNPLIMEHAELTKDIRDLEAQKRAHERSFHAAATALSQTRDRLARVQGIHAQYAADAKKVTDLSGDKFAMELTFLGDKPRKVSDRKKAGQAIRTYILGFGERMWGAGERDLELGTLSGFEIVAKVKRTQDGIAVRFEVNGEAVYESSRGAMILTEASDLIGLVRRLETIISSIPKLRDTLGQQIEVMETDIPKLEAKAVPVPFPKQIQLDQAVARILEIEQQLSESTKPTATQTDPAVDEFVDGVEELKRDLGIKTRRPDEDTDTEPSQDPGLRFAFAVGKLTEQIAEIDARGRGSRIDTISKGLVQFRDDGDRILVTAKKHLEVDISRLPEHEIRRFGTALDELSQIIENRLQAGYEIADEIEVIKEKISNKLDEIYDTLQEQSYDAAKLKDDLGEVFEAIEERLPTEEEFEEGLDDDEDVGGNLPVPQPPNFDPEMSALDALALDVVNFAEELSKLTAEAQKLLATDITSLSPEEALALQTDISEAIMNLSSLEFISEKVADIADRKQEEGSLAIDEIIEDQLTPVLDQLETLQEEIIDRVTDVEVALRNNNGDTPQFRFTGGKPMREDARMAIADALVEVAPRLPQQSRIRIFSSLSELPDGLRQHAESGQAVAAASIVQRLELAVQSGMSTADLKEAKRLAGQALRGETVEAFYHGGDIWIASYAANPAGRMTHETVHALRDLGIMTDAELKLLAERGRKIPDLFNRAAYKQAYKNNPRFAEVMAQEEAAHLVEARRNGQSFGREINTILDRILDFIERVRNALRGYGFQTADDVVRAVLSGEMAENGRPDIGPLFDQRRARPSFSLRSRQLESSIRALRPPADPFNEEEARQSAQHELTRYRPVSAPERVVREGLEELKQHRTLIPGHMTTGIMTNIRRVEGKPEVDVDFKTVSGVTLTVSMSQRDLLTRRTITVSRWGLIGFLRFADSEQIGETLRGELAHELVGANWSRIPDDVRSRLLAHADALGVLSQKISTYLRSIGDRRGARSAPDTTLKQAYGRIPDESFQEIKKVAHLVEGFSRGRYSEEDVSPVRGDIEAILTGQFTGREQSGPGLSPTPLFSFVDVEQNIRMTERWIDWTIEQKDRRIPIKDKNGEAFELHTQSGYGFVNYRLMDGGEEVGSFYVRSGGAVPGSVSVMNAVVDLDYQRRGLASAAYDAINADVAEIGTQLMPQGSFNLTPDGYAFWQARDPSALERMKAAEQGPSFAFAGVRAVKPPTGLDQAKTMSRRGRNPETVFEATGWFQGEDGHWRFEIDDSGAGLKDTATYFKPPAVLQRWKDASEAARNNSGLWSKMTGRFTEMQNRKAAAKSALENAPEWMTSEHTRVASGVLLRDILEHPELFNQYPFLRQMRVSMLISPTLPDRLLGGHLAYKVTKGRRIFKPIVVKAQTEVSALDTLLHEIQHYIQLREGFASGSSPKSLPVVSVDGGHPEVYSANTPRAIGLRDRESIDFRTSMRRRDLSYQTEAESYVDEMDRFKGDQSEYLREQLRESLLVGMDAYLEDSGESEANSIIARREMTREERRAAFPIDRSKPKADVGSGTTFTEAADKVTERVSRTRHMRAQWATPKDIGNGVMAVRPDENRLEFFKDKKLIARVDMFPHIGSGVISPELAVWTGMSTKEKQALMKHLMDHASRSMNIEVNVELYYDDHFEFWNEVDDRFTIGDIRRELPQLTDLINQQFEGEVEVTAAGEDIEIRVGENPDGPASYYSLYDVEGWEAVAPEFAASQALAMDLRETPRYFRADIIRERAAQGFDQPLFALSSGSQLDMSVDARMARAEALGFDTSQVWYHGTNNDFQAFDTKLLRRGKRGFGFYFTRDPNEASYYAQFRSGAQGGHQTVIPVYLKRPGPEVRIAGHHAVVTDPTAIRSVNAVFDPSEQNSSDILYRFADYFVPTSIDRVAKRNDAVPITKLRPWSRHPSRVLAFHGTEAAFEEFDLTKVEDLGIHFGTPGQATQFAQGKTGYKAKALPAEQEGRIFPVVLHLDRIITLPDLDRWHPVNVLKALEARGVDLSDRARNEVMRRSQGNSRNGLLMAQKVLRDDLTSQGYDGIRYLNGGEGGGVTWSYIVWNRNSVTSATSNAILYAFAPSTSPDPEETARDLLDEELAASGLVDEDGFVIPFSVAEIPVLTQPLENDGKDRVIGWYELDQDTRDIIAELTGFEDQYVAEWLEPHLVVRFSQAQRDGEYAHAFVDINNRASALRSAESALPQTDKDLGTYRPGQDMQASAIAGRPQMPGSRKPRPQRGTDEPMMSLMQLVEEFNRALGLTARYGRLDPALKAQVGRAGGTLYGQHSGRTGVIRIRLAQDFDTLSHEGGHALETRLGNDLLRLKQRHRNELEPLASMGDDQLSEGFAEFFRLYITNPRHAANQAPGFAKEFEALLQQREPEMLQDLAAIQEGYEDYLTSSSVGRGKRNQVFARRLGPVDQFRDQASEVGFQRAFYDRANRLYEWIVGHDHSWYLATKALADLHETNTGNRLELTAQTNPAKLFRRMAHTRSWAMSDMLRGVALQGSDAPSGPSLSDALSEALGGREAEKWNEDAFKEFGQYLIARRAVLLYVRHNQNLRKHVEAFVSQHQSLSYLLGRLPGPDQRALPRPPTEETLINHLTTILELEGKHPNYRRAASMVYGYQQNMVQLMRQSGFLSDQQAAQLLGDTDYVPFFRDMHEPNALGDPLNPSQSGLGTNNKHSLVRRIDGSSRPIINPIQSIMQYTFEARLRIAMNDTIQAMAELAEQAGYGAGAIFEPIPETDSVPMRVDVMQSLKRAAQEAGVDPSDTDLMMTVVEGHLGDSPFVTMFSQQQTKEKGEPIIWYWKDGKPMPGRLADNALGQMLFESMTAVGKRNTSLLLKAASLPAIIVRAGATKWYDFIFANVFRDAFAAATNSPLAVPFLTQYKGVKQILTNGRYLRMYEHYAGMMGGELTQAIEEATIERDINALRATGMRVERVTSVWKLLKAVLQVSEYSETATRVGLFQSAYERAIADGLSPGEAVYEAAHEAHDVIDFSRHGSKTEVLRRVVPFLNAYTQGVDKYRRALMGTSDQGSAISAWIEHRNSGRPMTRQERLDLHRSQRAWMMTVFGLGAMSMMVHFINSLGDDEEEEMDDEINDRVRATHWVINLKGVTYLLPKDWSLFDEKTTDDLRVRLPKPFEIAWVANAMERALDAARKSDPKAAERYAEDFWEIIAPPSSLPAFDLYYGQRAGHNFFFDKPIVPFWEKDEERPEQFGPYTSETARWLGEHTNISPYEIDNTIRGLFASAGRDLLALADQTVFDKEGNPTPRLDERIIVRRFLQDPARGSRSMSKFYDLYRGRGGFSGWFWDTVGEGARSMYAAGKRYKDAIDDGTEQKAEAYYQDFTDDQKAYASLMTHWTGSKKTRYRSLHPIENVRILAEVSNKMVKEMLMDGVEDTEFKDAGLLDFTPDQKRDIRHTIAHMRMAAAQNGLRILGVKGWGHRKPLDMDLRFNELRASAPKAYDELIRRLRKKKYLPMAGIEATWAETKKRLLEDRKDADLGDLIGEAMETQRY